MTQISFDDVVQENKINEMLESGKLWVATCFSWAMVMEADTKREAKIIGDNNVDSFGGIRGSDRCTVRKANYDDVATYIAMGGIV
jgi:hypothetical protein